MKKFIVSMIAAFAMVFAMVGNTALAAPLVLAAFAIDVTPSVVFQRQFDAAHACLFNYMTRCGLLLCMGNATGRDVHVDQALTSMAMGYRPDGFIADMIFPTVLVPKQADLYIEFSRADRLRVENTTRAPGTLARRITETVGSDTYFARNYALAKEVSIEDKTNADPLLLSNLYNGASTFLLDKLYLDWERRIALKVTSATNVGSSSAVQSAWNGAGNPLGNINTAIDNVRFSNGVRPTDVIFGEEAWNSFRRDSNIRNLIFGTNNGGGYPTEQQVATLLNVKRVHVAGAFYNSAQEGQSESLSSIWGDNVLVYYRPDAPTIERPSFGYNFRWSAPGIPNLQVERHPWDSKTKSEAIEVGFYQDEKVTGASYGFLLRAVNSST